jgi:sec-independent protein translocase protein TatB
MFDVSFTELLLIGVVALVVIGPERLPKVARTVGHMLGRAQRYVSDVKSDIQREIDLDEMNKLKKQMDDAAQSLQASMRETTASLQEPLAEARESLAEASASVESLVEQARRESGPEQPRAAPADIPAAVADNPDVPAPAVAGDRDVPSAMAAPPAAPPAEPASSAAPATPASFADTADARRKTAEPTGNPT